MPCMYIQNDLFYPQMTPKQKTQLAPAKWSINKVLSIIFNLSYVENSSIFIVLSTKNFPNLTKKWVNSR